MTTKTAADIISETGLALAFRHVPTHYDPKAKGDEWNHVEWQCTLTTPRGSFETTYSQGIDHLPKSINTRNPTLHDAEQIAAALNTGCHPRFKRLPTPDPLDVLAALCGNSTAADETFENWAESAGYDTDSRKAEATYNACRQIALDLLRILGAAAFVELRECEDIANR
jgi:hypothetical protein